MSNENTTSTENAKAETGYALNIPRIAGDPMLIEFLKGASTIFVGANGSGKSRLGSWIENQLTHNTLRIPAQKSLVFSNSISITNHQTAQQELRYGHSKNNQKVYRYNHQDPVTHFLSDYDKLLRALFSEDADIAVKLKDNELPDEATSITTLDKVKQVWEKVLPHRQLKKGSCQITICPVGRPEAEYSAEQLSDGERAIFYMLGQCMFAPEDAIIVVDEPELHIHKSIIKTLWDEIEAARPDCAFVYMTHDLDFAKSRTASQKFAVNSFENGKWDIIPIPTDSDFPEEIITKILGSRRPILFVEGDGSSIDVNIYSKVYPEFTIVPVGSAEQVIHSVKTFNNNNNLHHAYCAGLVDWDSRSETAIEKLKQDKIYVLPTVAIENILIIEDVISKFCHLLRYEQSATQAKIDEVKRTSFTLAEDNLDKYCLRHTKRVLDERLKAIELSATDIQNLTESVYAEISTINPREIYNEKKSALQQIIKETNYADLLKSFTNKGLIANVNPILGLTKNTYAEQLLRFVKSSEDNPLNQVLSDHLPRITPENRPEQIAENDDAPSGAGAAVHKT